jgi:catechol 2,3-dioxygenase-like lactoylglutathione lyase family enzyme
MPPGVDTMGSMTSKIDSLAVDCREPARVAQFWSDVLGWNVVGRDWQRTPHGRDGVSIADGSLQIDFRWTGDDQRAGKNRLHLDVVATDHSQAEELDRLLGLGATEVDIAQGDADWMTWHVLADPEGNVFCLVTKTP